MNRCGWSALFVVVIVLSAASRLTAETVSGMASFTGTKDHVKVTAGTGLKFSSDFYRLEFGGKISLAASGTVKNTSGKKLFGSLYIAFFDKDKNLIGTAARTLTLEPGKDLVAANVIEAPPDAIDKIVSYQITIYESEKEIGTK
jgi:hypothetical protein